MTNAGRARVALLLAMPWVVHADPLPAPAEPVAIPAAAANPAASVLIIPSGTAVLVRIDADVGSKISQTGQVFPIALARPIVIDGREVIPAGAAGEGQVVHAARARGGGKAGELILAARWIAYGGVRVPLRSLKMAGKGVDNTVVASLVGGFLVSGGNLDIQRNSVGEAKVAADTPLPSTLTSTGGTQ